MPSKHDVQIDLDVPRTVNDHVLFHTRYGQGYVFGLIGNFHRVGRFSTTCCTLGSARFSISSIASHYDVRVVNTVRAWVPSPPLSCSISTPR